MKSRIVLAIAVVLSLAVYAQADVTYNAGVEMAAYVDGALTGTLAPAFGQWSVGYRSHSTPFTTNSFTAYTAAQYKDAAEVDASLAGIGIWETSWAENMIGVQYSGSKNWNVPGSAMSTTSVNQMVIDQSVPTPTAGNMPVLRWTAPQDGTIFISTAFRALCENGNNKPIDVYLYKGRDTISSRLFKGTVGPLDWVNQGPEQDPPEDRVRALTSNITTSVLAGDVIDVFSYTTQGVNLLSIDSHVISYVPEPGSIAIVISGLMGLVCYAWKKRK
jgi:hypothetical protein